VVDVLSTKKKRTHRAGSGKGAIPGSALSTLFAGSHRTDLLEHLRSQKARSTFRPWEEPLWLCDARRFYGLLGACLDAIGAESRESLETRDAALTHLRTLHDAFTRRGTSKLAVQRIMQLFEDIANRVPVYAPALSTSQPAVVLCAGAMMIDPGAGSRLLDHTAEIDGILAEWPDRTPRSKKWSLLHALLRAALPDTEIPTPRSLQQNFARARRR
jgi:hypothetical protein